MLAPFLAFLLAAAGPSFDCSAARTADETAICADPGLSADDALMAILYDRARASSFGTGQSGEALAQYAWLKARACKPTPSLLRVECLRHAYAQRNHQLATAIAVRDPELALPVLRRLDPEGSPLVEATTLIARLPKGTTWNSPEKLLLEPRLISLLRPIAHKLFDTNEWSYGRDILADEKVANLQQALASESAFTSFVQISSAYLTEGPNIPRPLPCEAMVRRPDLLDATNAAFGSTFDNFIVTTDCDVTLAPMPSLDRLVSAINDSWPNCEGTIRFSAYRAFGVTVDMARLGFGRPSRKAATLPTIKGVSLSLVNAAVAELTGIYIRSGRALSPLAPQLARERVAGILGASHNCNDTMG